MQLIRLAEVLKQTGLSRSLLYGKLDNGDFPRPVKLGNRVNAWSADEIQEWISDKLADRLLER